MNDNAEKIVFYADPNSIDTRVAIILTIAHLYDEMRRHTSSLDYNTSPSVVDYLNSHIKAYKICIELLKEILQKDNETNSEGEK